MGKVSLTLGGVAFQDMEVPEVINFGGRQRVAVQELIGGGRAVQALGVDEGGITFSGIFSGSDAATRAQILDAARATGAVLPLVWDNFYYSVIIEKFEAEYRKSNFIPFKIICVVVNDLVNAVVEPLVSIVASDLNSVKNFSDMAGISISSLSITSTTGYAEAKTQIAGSIASSGTTISDAGLALNTADNTVVGITALQAVNSAASQLAGAASMRGYINRAVRNSGAASI